MIYQHTVYNHAHIEEEDLCGMPHYGTGKMIHIQTFFSIFIEKLIHDGNNDVVTWFINFIVFTRKLNRIHNQRIAQSYCSCSKDRV